MGTPVVSSLAVSTAACTRGAQPPRHPVQFAAFLNKTKHKTSPPLARAALRGERHARGVHDGRDGEQERPERVADGRVDHRHAALEHAVARFNTVADCGLVITVMTVMMRVCCNMCVECLIGKQKKPILFKVTEPSSIPRTLQYR